MEFTARIGTAGRVVIPAPIRKALNMNIGKMVIMEIKEVM